VHTELAHIPSALFFERWLSQQGTLRSGTWVQVLERLDPTGAGPETTPRIRLLKVRLGTQSAYASCTAAAVAAAARHIAQNELAHIAEAPGPDLVAAAAARGSAEDALKAGKRVHKLRRFGNCQAVLAAADDQPCFEYGAFPLTPGVESAAGLKHVAYEGFSVLPPSEWPRAHLNHDAAEVPAALGRRLWEQFADTSDAAVDNYIENIGMRPLPLERRAPDGPMRQAFRLLAQRAISGYAAATDPNVRDAMLRRLIALPYMHLRRLVGVTASPHARKLFLQQQLSGVVCVQPLADRTAHPRKPRTMEEHVEHVVRAAFKLACENQIGRAAATLVRDPPVVVDPARKYADLAALHPDGAPPTHVVLPAVPFFSATTFTSDDIRKSVRSCVSGSAPGPDGWTFEALHDALEDDIFATDFHAVIVDICNGHVAPRTARLLAASSLIGIPKGKTADDGTRPIALGSTFLKVASARALKAAAPQLQARFAGSQFGCAAKGGAESIVHLTRRFVREGIRADGSQAPCSRVVITLDFANAFNTPTRQAMWEATRTVPALVGIFKISYEQPSELFVVGSAGPPLLSKRGARQGTTDGPPTFALTLQPALDAARALEGVDVLAYLDDITINAVDEAAGAQAAHTIIARAKELGMAIKIAKCEFMAVDGRSAPANSMLSSFRRVDVVKLLGASIAPLDLIEERHLFEREREKITVALSRMRHCASPQLFAVLRSCIVAKLAYAVRVHGPNVSGELARHFDAQVEELVSHWASVRDFTQTRRLIIGLPRVHGGLGLTRMMLIAPAAYLASQTAALQPARARGGRVLSQRELCEMVYSDVLAHAVANDPALGRHLAVQSLDGSDAGLSCLASRVHADVFGALLRTYMMADSCLVTGATLQCRGCGGSFAVGGDWGQHVSSCVATKGGLVTRRHNAAVNYLRPLLAEGGLQPDATEPRDLARYTCGCGGEFTHAAYAAHKSACPKASTPLHVSGPDIRYRADGKTIVADVTIVNLLTVSHSNDEVHDAFAAARKRKEQRYGAMCTAADAKLLTLAASANGHLSVTTRRLVDRLAAATFRDRLNVRTTLSALIAHGSAAARLRAEQYAGVCPPSIEASQVALRQRLLVAPMPATAAVDGQLALLHLPTSQPPLPPLTASQRLAASYLAPRICDLIADKMASWLERVHVPAEVVRREAAELRRRDRRHLRRQQRREDARGEGFWAPSESDSDASDGSADVEDQQLEQQQEQPQQQQRQQRDADAPREGADDERAPDPPRLLLPDPASAAFSADVIARTRVSTAEARARSQSMASEAAAETQRNAASTSVHQLQRQSTSLLSVLGARKIAAELAVAAARAESVAIQRIDADATERCAAAQRTLLQTAARASQAAAAIADTVRRAKHEAEQAEHMAVTERARAEATRERSRSNAVAAEAERARSVAATTRVLVESTAQCSALQRDVAAERARCVSAAADARASQSRALLERRRADAQENRARVSSLSAAADARRVTFAEPGDDNNTSPNPRAPSIILTDSDASSVARPATTARSRSVCASAKRPSLPPQPEPEHSPEPLAPLPDCFLGPPPSNPQTDYMSPPSKTAQVAAGSPRVSSHAVSRRRSPRGASCFADRPAVEVTYEPVAGSSLFAGVAGWFSRGRSAAPARA
jgi:hypothetical protein